MSKKRLKNHRKLHSIKLPCPICSDCEPKIKSNLVVRCYKYFVYDHDVMWDGATLYLNKEQWTNKKEKAYFEIHCSNGCDLNTLFEHESQLKEVLLPYVETLFEELVKVPLPPKSLPMTQSKQKEKKWVLRLVPRVPA